MARRTMFVGMVLSLSGFLGASAVGEESWDAIYHGLSKIGHTHIKVEQLEGPAKQPLLRVQVNTVMSYSRGLDKVDLEMRYGTIETPQGSVLKLDVRVLTGGAEMRTYGEAKNGKMQLTFDKGAANHQVKTIPWSANVFGPYAAELSLARKPIQAGERRTLHMFVPVLNEVCELQLVAGPKEGVVLGGGESRSLIRIEQIVKDKNGKPITESNQTSWVDENGQVLKSHQDILGGIDTYRTTETAALAPNGDFDIMPATFIKLEQPIPDPTSKVRAVYRVSVRSGDLATLLPNDQRQKLELTNPKSGRLTVQIDGPTTGTAGSGAIATEYLRANPLLNSEDTRVVAQAKKAVGRLTDPWQKAVAIEDWVWRNIQDKDFSVVFENAAEVARSLEGDCTEHGVLAAAMCRAAGLPSRVVVGLVYVPKQKGFGPHLWNEVYVNGRWVAFDATFNESAVDATHIALGKSSLDGISPFEVFTPVLHAVDQLQIDLIEAR